MLPKYRQVSDLVVLVELGNTRSIAICVLYGALQFG